MHVWFPSPFQGLRFNLWCRTKCRALTAARAVPQVTNILKRRLLSPEELASVGQGKVAGCHR